MNKGCCDVKITKVENGYQINISGEGIKEKCKSVFENCCTDENIKKCFQNCCATKE